MSGQELVGLLLESERLGQTMNQIALESVWRDLPAIKSEETDGHPDPDWRHAISCASVLAQIRSEAAQEAALRIAQGCITSEKSDREERGAAALILERLGNRLALGLAASRLQNLGIDEESWAKAPGPLMADVVRRRLELSIPTTAGVLDANPFQRELWTALSRSGWVSAAAPTSAGKSYIVKRWFEEQITNEERFRGVYIVPTRALIEEVSREFREEMSETIGIYTIPWDKDIDRRPHEVYIFTQERLHFLHELYRDFAADLLFIDEAQKFGDEQRGVLLQRVLADAVVRNPEVQVVFASPMAENPEVLLDDAPAASASVLSETVTVNQNLLWVNQVYRHPTVWKACLVDGDKELVAGTFDLPARPVSTTKRLPFVAVALGGSTTGNVVYVNGAASAETTAEQIADALGPEADISESEEISALAELVSDTIHRSYALLSVLKRGVAFHYGNMPLLVRREIEDLFRAETLRYLVCTSTLLEGVNLPCRNIFVRTPKKGNKAVMSSADFWNLAGRAGRWGKEFEGNIICVDPNEWNQPPRQRVRTPLQRVTEPILSDLPKLREYIEAGAPAEEARNRRLEEDVFSFLSSWVADGRRLDQLPTMPADRRVEVGKLEAAVKESLKAVELPNKVIRRHAGISPPAMQRLLSYMRGHDDQEAMLLAQPEDRGAAVNYKRALARCDAQLGSSFGPEKRKFQLAILVVEWMRGARLAYLISKRIQINSSRGEKKIASDIRAVMKDIDEIARFRAPKYLACYLDVLKVHLQQTGRADQIESLPDVAMMLELGVARTTEVSMMTLGLSRASAVELEERITDDELTPEQCLEWLRSANIEGAGLPRLVEREIDEVLGRADIAS